ncbi:MAG: hypothetical protein HYY01_00255 [Chloroflexi bacterium]|nr:hypothetical protein [Chloroflexota bacterium]
MNSEGTPLRQIRDYIDTTYQGVGMPTNTPYPRG